MLDLIRFAYFCLPLASPQLSLPFLNVLPSERGCCALLVSGTKQKPEKAAKKRLQDVVGSRCGSGRAGRTRWRREAAGSKWWASLGERQLRSAPASQRGTAAAAARDSSVPLMANNCSSPRRCSAKTASFRPSPHRRSSFHGRRAGDIWCCARRAPGLAPSLRPSLSRRVSFRCRTHAYVHGSRCVSRHLPRGRAAMRSGPRHRSYLCTTPHGSGSVEPASVTHMCPFRG